LSFELKYLNGTNGVQINGLDLNDYSGSSVSSAGDLNGDGIDDLIIGAPSADPNGNSGAGESYVVFGTTDWSSWWSGGSALTADNAVFQLYGYESSAYSGSSVSSAGDVNADGIDDIIIGAYQADVRGSGDGESYLVFGSVDWGGNFPHDSLKLVELDGTNGVQINGIYVGDFSGSSVSSAGDVNGDGIDDIIIGAPTADPNGNSGAGESYVVFGATNWTSQYVELSALDGTNGFQINGIDADDDSGSSVSSAGDVNGDGIDDIIIGAPGADPNGNSGAGESYVVFGATDWTSQFVELSALDGTNGFQINGIDRNDISGFSVSSAGDVNGDGIDDIIIGAIGADPNGNSRAGESYVVFGATNWTSQYIELSALDGTNGFQINGIDAYDDSGISVSSAGDVNGDSVDDIIIGAPGADPNGNFDVGESYVIFGMETWSAASFDLSELNGTNGFQINGIDAYDRSGISVSSAGDVNGDGIDDIIIGAAEAEADHNSRAGESYVVFGRLKNSVPSGNLIISGTEKEGATLSLTDTIADIDGLGSFSYQWLRDGAFILDATSSSYTLTQDDVGAEIAASVNYTDNYGTDEIVTSSVVGPILNVNEYPVILSTELATIDEDSVYSYTFLASDVDVGDTLTLSYETLPSWMSFDASTGVLSGTPTNSSVGDHDVVLRATDAAGAYTEQSFTISVEKLSLITLRVGSTIAENLDVSFISSDDEIITKTVNDGQLDYSGISEFKSVTLSSSSYSADINISDVVSSLRHIVGLETLSDSAFFAGDIDNDGQVNIGDVVSQLRHIVGLEMITSFDVVDASGLAINNMANVTSDLQLILNGDVDLSTTLHSDYAII
jgi:hypothetical protein